MLQRSAVQKSLEPLARPIDPRLNGLDRDAQEIGRLLLAEVVEVGQEQRLLKLGGQLVDRFLNQGPTLDRNQLSLAIGGGIGLSLGFR